jgi:hypothetical protein
MFALLLALSCEQDPRTSAPGLSGPAMDPEGIEDCSAAGFGELDTLCRVALAGRAGAAGDRETSALACAGIPAGRWRQECDLEAARGLAAAGLFSEALGRCAAAGERAEPCAVQLAWVWRGPLLRSRSSDPETARRIRDWVTAAREALSGMDAPPLERALQALEASLWVEAYLGTGLADPTAALAAESPLARTGYALEAARLAGAEEGAAAWRQRRALSGPPEPRARWALRLAPPAPPPAPQVRQLPLFLDAVRDEGRDEGEDLQIALLEGLFLSPGAGPAAFAPWLTDPRGGVRRAALKLYVLAGGDRPLGISQADAAWLDALADAGPVREWTPGEVPRRPSP